MVVNEVRGVEFKSVMQNRNGFENIIASGISNARQYNTTVADSEMT